MPTPEARGDREDVSRLLTRINDAWLQGRPRDLAPLLHDAIVMVYPGFAFDMTYERAGGTYRGTGRDLWVFAKDRGTWLAVWRTLLDVAEEPVSS